MNHPFFNTLVLLAIGLVAGAFIFWVGSVLVERRRAEARNRALEPEPSEEPAGDDPFVSGRQRERRTAVRRGGNPVVLLISDEAAKAQPIRGHVVDRSAAGICISCEAEIEVGSILSLRAVSAPETVPWVQVEVRNCRLAGKDHEIGCQWRRTPPWSVLLLFG